MKEQARASDAEASPPGGTLRVRRTGGILEVHASGMLGAAHYARFTPKFERAMDEVPHPARMLLELDRDFGWTPGGLAADLMFDLRHRRSFERIAVIGSRPWHRWITALGRPLFHAEMRFFCLDQRSEARAWLGGGC